MELDTKKVMVLLQRKWNSIREIDRLTKELEEAFARNDEVSVAMLLQLRADEMGAVERCMEDLWQLGEISREDYEALRELITSDPQERTGKTPEEKKIYEIRRKTQCLLDKLRESDQQLNQKMAGNKSYYRREQ